MARFDIVDNDPTWIDCPRCDGTGRYDGDEACVCFACDGTGDEPLDMSPLLCLTHNLAIGGALCEAFYDGFRAANGPRPLQCRPGRNLAAKEQG